MRLHQTFAPIFFAAGIRGCFMAALKKLPATPLRKGVVGVIVVAVVGFQLDCLT